MERRRVDEVVGCDARVVAVQERIAVDPATSVRSLAASVRLSPGRLEHLYKSHNGECLRSAILEARMSKAATLLRSSFLSVKEISFEVGYKHPPSFIRAFRTRFRRTPNEFRNDSILDDQNARDRS